MTVYLKGKNGRVDQVETNVQAIIADRDYIEIRYDGTYGSVVGVTYSTTDMEIEKIDA